MSHTEKILIVGAGPAGLSAALFLSERGLKVRIIDKKDTISPYSKALGVNPRTLELLENSGLTKRFLTCGRKMERINMWQGDKLVFHNDLREARHKYPFMLIQPQRISEELLREALCERGIEVQSGVTFKELQPTAHPLHVSLQHETKQEENAYEIVIGADGGNSAVREQLGISFQGFRYDEQWELYDVVLKTHVNRDEGHIRLFKEGGMIMIRLQEDVWRIAGNMKDLLNFLPAHTQTGEVIWRSTFRISHKVAERLEKNNVALIGDAAHLHSPVGARGMNLGIEDAYLLSKLIAENRLADYTTLRHAYLRQTVSRINRMTQTLAGSGLFSQSLRSHISLLSPFFPWVIPIMRKFLLGLNKPIP